MTPSLPILAPVPPLEQFRAQLTQRLQRAWAGAAVRLRLAPELSYGRHRGPAPPGARQAAVVVLFYPHHGIWHLPLTLRPHWLPDHAGQVSLPGGAIDPGETEEQCALRELREELGVTAAPEQIVGRLSPVYVYSSYFRVQPLVAVSSLRPAFAPNATEVAQLLELPVPHLLDPAHRGSHVVERTARTFAAPHIECAGQRIWGATAVMLAELICVLGDVEP